VIAGLDTGFRRDDAGGGFPVLYEGIDVENFRFFGLFMKMSGLTIPVRNPAPRKRRLIFSLRMTSLLWLLLPPVLLSAASVPAARAAGPCRAASEQLRQGLHHLTQGEDEAALVQLSEAAALAPRCTRVYYPLGLSLERTGKHDRAIEAHTLAALAPDAA